MGIENATPHTVYVYDTKTGERVGELSDLTTVTLTTEQRGYGPEFKASDSLSFELCPVRMSRKRFVKKLMGMGISRNAANTYAKICAEHKRPYGQQYWAVVMFDLLG